MLPSVLARVARAARGLHALVKAQQEQLTETIEGWNNALEVVNENTVRMCAENELRNKRCTVGTQTD